MNQTEKPKQDCPTTPAGDCSPELIERYDELRRAISDLQATNSALVTATRSNCLSEFVSAVAHELNNPVGALTSSVDSIKRSLARITEAIDQADSLESLRSDPRLSKARQVLTDNTRATDQATERIGAVIQRLKRFAHLDQAEFQPIDLNDMLENGLAMVEHRLENRIEIIREFGRIPRLLGYPKRLNEAFLAILRNAIRSIDDTGSIRISTAADDHHVFVTISDTGHGIPLEKRKHLFDFAFTTTGNRVGVQTGLSSSYHTVKLHGGDIMVDSEVGKGTRVTIELPVRPPDSPDQSR